MNDSSQSFIKNATDYFKVLYPSHDITHKWISLYGKWNKQEHRGEMINCILGKDFVLTKKQTRSPYHYIENLLHGEILAEPKNLIVFPIFS